MLLRWLKRCAPLGIALIGVAVVPAASARAIGHAASSCNLAGKYRTLGPTYVESLSVTNTSCNTGISLIKAYNACRLKAGGRAGRCTSTIQGFRFTEKRQSSQVQFVALVTATKGKDVVKFTYTENTA